MKPKQPHNSQRGQFAYELYDHMQENSNIWIVTCGLGYGMMDFLRQDFADRFIDVGAAEMAGMAISIGLAKQGKIPVCYSITPFLLRRPYELVKLYLDEEQVPVKLAGSGIDNDYKHDGPSHWAYDAQDLMDNLDIAEFWPETKEDIPNMMDDFLYSGLPSFMALRR